MNEKRRNDKKQLGMSLGKPRSSFMENKKARVIAFYLPQFYPIPENDAWWGKGFTEWTNVGKAKPLFKGHYQPRVPADLGYYDLRLPEVREAQAAMARQAGIEGFMYWHYWFGGGRTLLERPFKEVLESGTPQFPFCLGWANHSWTNQTWDVKDQYKTKKVFMDQRYPGEKDYREHFYAVLKAFQDSRYILVEGNPLFYIYAPYDFSEIEKFISLWRKLAVENGLKGVYFIGQARRNVDCKKLLELGFNGVCRGGVYDAQIRSRGKFINKILWELKDRVSFAPLNKYKYSDIADHLVAPDVDKQENVFPMVISNYDHSPRSGRRATIFVDSTPNLFKRLLHKTIQAISEKDAEHKIIFLKSWNEWAEGNHVEPDLKYGHGYLEALREEIGA